MSKAEKYTYHNKTNVDYHHAPCHRVGVLILSMVKFSVTMALMRVVLFYFKEPTVSEAFRTRMEQQADFYIRLLSRLNREKYFRLIFYDKNLPANGRYLDFALLSDLVFVMVSLLGTCTVVLLVTFNAKKYPFTLYLIPFTLTLGTAISCGIATMFALDYINDKSFKSVTDSERYTDAEMGLFATMLYQVRYRIENDNVPQNDTYNQDIVDAWKVISRQMQCCGVSGPEDFLESAFAEKMKSKPKMFVPDMCCIMKHADTVEMIIGSRKTTYNETNATPINHERCQRQARYWDQPVSIGTYSFAYTAGCYNKLAAWIYNKIHVMSILKAIILVVEITIMTIISLFLISNQHEVDRVDRRVNIVMPNRML